MKKQIKTLVVMGIVAAVLLGAWGILSLLMPKEEDPEAGKTYLIKENAGDYAVITVEYPEDFLKDHAEGYKYLIGQKPLTDGSGLVYEFNDNGVDDDYAYSQSLMNSTFTTLTALEYVEIVEEDAPNVEKYGLTADKAARITLIPYDSEKTSRKVLLLGSKYELDDYYYVMLEGENTVYTCKSSAVNIFLGGSKSLRDLNLIPSLGENFINLKNIRMERPDGSVISFERLSSEELQEMSEIYSSYRLLEPYAAYGNDTYISDGVLSPLSQVIAVEAVEDRVKDLSEYGLDKPYRVTITVEGKKEPVTLLFDSLSSGTRYMMVEGVDTVYSAISLMSDFSFLDVDAMRLRSGLVWLHSIKNIKEVSMHLPNGKHVLWVDDQIDPVDNSGTFEAKLNGQPVSEDNARALYMSVISIAYDAELAGEVTETAPTHSFTITYRNGRKEYLSLYRVNNRQYAVRLNNAPMEDVGFTVNIASLRKVEENIATILSGGTIK